MEKTDFKIGIVFLSLSLIVIVLLIPDISEVWRESAIAGDQFFTLGPRFLPYVASSLMGLLSAWLILSSRRQPRSEGVPQPDSSPSNGLAPVAVFAAIGTAYVAALPYLGVLFATPLCLAASFLYFGVRKWVWLVLFPLVITAVVVVSFEYLMRVELP